MPTTHIDQSGNTINNIYLIEIDKDNKKSGTYYKCRCVCGNIYSCRYYEIVNNTNKKCKQCIGTKIKINNRYADWTVLERLGDIRKTGHVYWKCRCICNVEDEINTNAILISKKCWHNRPKGSDRFSWKGYKNISGTKWSSIKQCAKERDIEFNITKEQVWDIGEKQNWKCALSGLDASYETYKIDKYNNKFCTASIDRIDSNIGYEVDNIWIVHKDVNKIKWSLDLEEFLTICYDITNPIINNKVNKIENIHNAHYSKLINCANTRKIYNNITKENIIELYNHQEGRCYLSNYTLNLMNGYGDICNSSIDRINPNIGYVKDNLAWSYKKINLMRWNLELEYFKELCKLITYKMKGT